MNRLAEIVEMLPKLSDAELREVERRLLAEYRRRHFEPLYSDAYGDWTEEDQMAVAAQVFALLDREEEEAARKRRQS
jgi:hypothetical protein